MNVMNHMGQCVTDLERSRTFYEQALGFEFWRLLELDDEPSNRLLRLDPPLGFRACYLRAGPFVLELLHFAGSGAAPAPYRVRTMNEIGITHMSLSVDDIPGTCALVEQYGGTVLTDTDIGGGLFVQDPDGQLVELLPMAYAERVAAEGLMDLGLRDRAAIVTGASRGIGRQIALDLAREGTHLVLNARNASALETTAHECEAHGVRVVQVVADLLDHDAAPLIAERAMGELGRIDILVNNAGGGGGVVRLHKLTDDDWHQGFELNFFSCVRITNACLPVMLERGWGRIVSLASTYGVEPGPLFGPYSAAKAALLNYSKNLSRAFAAQGVLANCVIPGITLTEAITENAEAAAAAEDSTPDDVMARMMKRDPVSMGRFGEPQEVAAAVVFLASEAASWITGAALAVDGGTLRSI